MNKYLKGCLIFLGIIVSLILIVVLWWNIASYQGHNRAEEDGVEFSKICDTIQTITEQPGIGISNFHESEIKKLRFQIKRNDSIVSDTLLKNPLSYISDDKRYGSVKIPFPEFKKSDTIIITTVNNLKFYISDFRHYSNLHFGMFGYVEGGDCRLSETFNINKSYRGTISKEIAFLDSDKGNRIKIINPMDEELKEISSYSKINLTKAEEIFDKNKLNQQLISKIFCGIYVEKLGNYYVFKEELENKKNQFDIIKINAETGKYKRYKNFPFD